MLRPHPSSRRRLGDLLWLWRFRLRAWRDLRLGVSRTLDRPDGAPPPSPGRGLPRRIWIYWEQGWDEAPELVAACRRSWIDRNPDWELVSLDSANLSRHVAMGSETAGKPLSRNHLANMIRLRLLAGQGGVWVDATTFCSTPLTDWLPSLMETGFFAFSRPGKDRLLSTWFLASEPGHPLAAGWLDRAIRYWRLVDKADFYHWCHYLFADACRDDPRFRAFWAATPRLSADGPHQVQYRADRTDGIADLLESLAAARVPVHKLSWRLAWPPADAATPLAALLHGL
jgi:capsular polysaccharide synthesis protein